MASTRVSLEEWSELAAAVGEPALATPLRLAAEGLGEEAGLTPMIDTVVSLLSR